MRGGERHETRGDTLVEVLVALAILGIGITGLVAVLGTHSSTTVVNRDQSQTQTTLLSAAEYVKSLPFTGCTPTGWTTVNPNTQFPYDNASFNVEFGNARALGAVACSKLAVVTVRVTGQGFQGVQLDVVKRP